jgi:4-alpha-glucanotransferase
LQEFAQVAASEIAEWKFIQWCFDRQWAALRAYASARGIAIIGDLPIFVADNGVDLWAHPELFDLDADGRPRVVAGVPPDYFSATGQHWGNPLYDWPAHAREGFRWWKKRLRRVLAHCDRVRIDHFRGFESYWAIPAGESTALKGRWVSGPGAAFFHALAGEIDIGALLAEDLGIITPAVRALRRELGLPGMAILQFAFDGKTANPYLPHNLRADCAVYTGTHDNDTVRGWWETLDATTRRQVADYLGLSIDALAAEPHWALIRAASASVASDCLLPMQDVLGLGGDSRLNRPGEATGCWEWRFHWDQVGPQPAERLAGLTRLYGRAATSEDAPAAAAPASI